MGWRKRGRERMKNWIFDLRWYCPQFERKRLVPDFVKCLDIQKLSNKVLLWSNTLGVSVNLSNSDMQQWMNTISSNIQINGTNPLSTCFQKPQVKFKWPGKFGSFTMISFFVMNQTLFYFSFTLKYCYFINRSKEN